MANRVIILKNYNLINMILLDDKDYSGITSWKNTDFILSTGVAGVVVASSTT
jgi:hypothetical protein